MKTLAAVLTILALGVVSGSALAAGCGSNTSRNANTRPNTGTAAPSANSPATVNNGFHH